MQTYFLNYNHIRTLSFYTLRI